MIQRIQILGDAADMGSIADVERELDGIDNVIADIAYDDASVSEAELVSAEKRKKQKRKRAA